MSNKEQLYEVCHRTETATAEVRDALGGIKTHKSQDPAFWANAEMSKAHEACGEAIQGTAELKQQLYPQLGQKPQESVTINYGLGGRTVSQQE